jgi:hypothetical protein
MPHLLEGGDQPDGQEQVMALPMARRSFGKSIKDVHDEGDGSREGAPPCTDLCRSISELGQLEEADGEGGTRERQVMWRSTEARAVNCFSRTSREC